MFLPSHSKNFKDILINGNERISNESIMVFSEIPDNQNLDENSINLILKNLFETGFFQDVSIALKDDNLVINVIENPIIQEVFIEGIKRTRTEKDLYDLVSLKNRSSYNSLTVKQDEIVILNFLKEKGYYFSSIESSNEDLGNKKINLYYKITLGKKAKISKISFIGDKNFKDSTLRDVIISEEDKFWKVISKKIHLNEKLINFDKKLLYNFYRNKGYYDVNIESSFANYLGNSEFEIIYNINANKKYYFNDLTLKLPIDYDASNFVKLNSLFTKLKGEYYSINSIDRILNEIDKIVLNEQYEFLKSTVDEEINDNLINLTFNITESDSKFYVEKINIFGNNITQEEVLRNNLTVDEGDAFNELLHKKTLNNLRSLNFFKKVDSEIVNGSDDNQKIINLTVEEKPTGEITAGAGLGTDGASIGFSVKENNFLGKGIAFGSDISLSGDTVKGLFSLYNPNYKGTDRSLRFSAESSITDRLTNFGYESNKTGASISSGVEYYDDVFLDTGFSIFLEDLTTSSKASASLKKQQGSYFDTFFNYTFDYDKRNQRYKTTDGFRSKFSQKIPLISDNYTLTNTYDFRLYEEWFNENIGSLGFYAKTTTGFKNENVRLSNRLYLPARKLRGFESGKVGPKDGADFIGGNYIMAFNASTTLTQVLQSLQNTNFSLFLDAANIWGIDYNDSLSDNSKLRSSFGLAVEFYTPIGPLNFSLAEVISKSSTDVAESFRFNLGTTF